jgi:hypothetical protein
MASIYSRFRPAHLAKLRMLAGPLCPIVVLHYEKENHHIIHDSSTILDKL